MARTTTTRERLIRTAAELFWRQGYAATGVTAILRRAGVTSGSFYHFFSSKEDLLLAVLDATEEMLQVEIFGPAEAATEDPIERVFAVLDFYRRYLVSHRFELGCPMGGPAAELSASRPRVRARVAGLFKIWKDAVEAFLVAAGDRLPGEVDRGALAEMVLAVMEGAVIQARARRSLAPFDAAVGQLRRFFDLLEDRAGRAAEVPVSAIMERGGGAESADWRAW